MSRTTFIVIPLCLAVGCSADLPVSPDTAVMPSGPVMAASPSTVVQSATGHDRDELRNFSFAGLRRSDGSASGQWEIHFLFLSVRMHGRVTCLSVDGNAAWFGGVIEQIEGAFPNPLVVPGTPARWRVVDNGEGANAAPDLVSGWAAFPGLSEGVELGYCANRPANPALREVDIGNVRVRGG